MAPPARPPEDMLEEHKAIVAHLVDAMKVERIRPCLPYLPGGTLTLVQPIFEPENGGSGFGETLFQVANWDAAAET